MLFSPRGRGLVGVTRRLMINLNVQSPSTAVSRVSPAVLSRRPGPTLCAVPLFGRSCFTMTTKRTQPAWQTPEQPTDGAPDQPAGRLRLFNSLTRQKEVFVPQDAHKVTWYSCGPTVYDASHMGHARTYLAFDVLRRVIQNYFGYNVFYVMNITDVDDKIIKQTRQNLLFDQYKAKNHPLEKLLEDCNLVLKQFLEVAKATEDPDKRAMQDRMSSKLSQAVQNLEECVKGGKGADAVKSAQEQLLEDAKPILSDWLDQQFGKEIQGNEHFRKLPEYWEEQFHQDMAALNILPADCLTRVSEYIPENVAFIEQVISNGFAYESNGSVYFDVGKFNSNPDHFYAKLVPEAFGDAGKLREGEGALSLTEDRLKEKRSDNDFALWKCSKPGEPSWASPWGQGRPGWHVECSAMASDVLGKSIDIHSGGVDLKFPHHDNELAQSEAYHCNDNWIRYFLHSGHLTIAGCKMSKSLKNFITIQEVLQTYSARQLRLVFLLHSWKDTLDYSNETMQLAVSYEKTVNEFFLVVKHVLRTTPSHGLSAFQKWTPDEKTLEQQLHACQRDVDRALCDNVDTRATLEALKELVANGNAYLERKKKNADSPQPNRVLLKKCAEFITKMFDVFGLLAKPEEIGFPASGAQGAQANTEELLLPYLNAMSEFRDSVRKQARELKATDILKECDRLRDDVLPELGVRLEDKENEPTVMKLVDKAELMRERQLKLEMEEKQREEKERKKAAAAEKQAALEAQRRIPPKEMFKKETDKYSKFDDKGMPTHDAKGEEIAKAQLKKLQKLYQAQEKKHNDFLKSQSEQ